VLTLVFNWINRKAEELKQDILSLIEIFRGKLYHWAFNEEEASTHITLDDQEYYFRDPRRFELIPHSENHCLFHNLLDEEAEQETVPSSPRHYKSLFSHEPTVVSDTFQSPTNATNL
jgi:hypothetical protein